MLFPPIIEFWSSLIAARESGPISVETVPVEVDKNLNRTSPSSGAVVVSIIPPVVAYWANDGWNTVAAPTVTVFAFCQSAAPKLDGFKIAVTSTFLPSLLSIVILVS